MCPCYPSQWCRRVLGYANVCRSWPFNLRSLNSIQSRLVSQRNPPLHPLAWQIIYRILKSPIQMYHYFLWLTPIPLSPLLLDPFNPSFKYYLPPYIKTFKQHIGSHLITYSLTLTNFPLKYWPRLLCACFWYLSLIEKMWWNSRGG